MADSRLSPARATLAPAIVAVAFVALVFGSLWYQTRVASQAKSDLAASVAARAAASVPAPAAPGVPAARPAVSAFLAFAKHEAPEVLQLDHGHTSEGLRLLAAALEAADAPLAAAHARGIRRAADLLGDDPRSLRHAAMTRGAFLSAAEALRALRSSSADTASGSDDRVRRAAEAIRADQPLRSQRARIERFFDEAAAALAAPRPHSA